MAGKGDTNKEFQVGKPLCRFSILTAILKS